MRLCLPLHAKRVLRDIRVTHLRRLTIANPPLRKEKQNAHGSASQGVFSCTPGQSAPLPASREHWLVSAERRCYHMSSKTRKKADGYIYCAYVIRNGKYVYPKKARCFRFRVNGK